MSFDVIVVGGGVIGATILQALSLRGYRCLLLEQGAVASGATAHSGAMVRSLHLDSWLSDLAFDSLARFHAFASEVGEGCGFVPTGALYFATPAERTALAAESARLIARGAELIPLTAAEGRQQFPQFDWADDDWAVFEPGAGYADPVRTTQAWLGLAQRLGAVVMTQTPIDALLQDGSRIVGVQAGSERYHAPLTVLATGAWTAELLQPLGVQIELQLRAIQKNHLDGSAPAELPCYFDLRTHGFGRPHSAGGAWIGQGSEPVSAEEPDLAWQPGEAETARTTAIARSPALREAELTGGVRAIDAYAPGRRGLLGPVDDIEGVFLAVGWGGTGFKLAPAIGERVADRISQTLPHLSALA